MALGVQPSHYMNTRRIAPRIARTLHCGFAAVSLTALALTGSPAAAAPTDGKVLPPEQHTSDKGRRLATTYNEALRDLNTRVYHCMPWVEVKPNGIGFYKPKHLEGDTRYLSINIYIDQQPSPEFTAYTVEERASRMFSRYVGPMLRRMARPPALLADASLDGFTVILEWLKQTAAPGGRPVHETIAVFMDRKTVADYLNGRLTSRDLPTRARVLGWDGATALGPLKVNAWDDDFVSTYKIANYQLAPGVSCP